jgi:hypothetical protein
MVVPEGRREEHSMSRTKADENSWAQLSPAARLNAVGLIVAAAGVMIQYVSGVDFPTIPPGPTVLLAAAAVVVFGPWRRAAAVGLVAAAFVSLGGVIATIAGNGFNSTLGDPSEVGGFVGAVVQIAGLMIALPAGVVAVRSLGSRAEPRATSAAHRRSPASAA